MFLQSGFDQQHLEKYQRLCSYKTILLDNASYYSAQIMVHVFDMQSEWNLRKLQFFIKDMIYF